MQIVFLDREKMFAVLIFRIHAMCVREQNLVQLASGTNGGISDSLASVLVVLYRQPKVEHRKGQRIKSFGCGRFVFFNSAIQYL